MLRGALSVTVLSVLPSACDSSTAAVAADAGGDARSSTAGFGGAGGSGGIGGARTAGTTSGGGVHSGGGASTSGGRANAGGTAASSGGANAGGGTASGGGIGAGGAPASGGRASAGGASTKGGATMAGGTPSSGGASGSAADGSAGSVTYTTNFDLTEAPLSESGAWHHDGLDWTTVDSGNGIAYGTQALGVPRSGPTGYNDSYAYLAGFPPDQQASAVIHLGTVDGSCTHEVEIVLRWADSTHDARGYECNVAFDGSYAQIVRWNGPVGDYTYLANGSVAGGGVHDGDTVSASIVGNQITLSVNGVVRATATDATYATGNHGVAFWRGSSGCGTLGDYGFTSFTASSIP